MKIKAIWEFDADVSDILPEYVDVKGFAIDLAKNKLNNLLYNFEVSAEDFKYEVEGEISLYYDNIPVITITRESDRSYLEDRNGN